MNHPGRNRSSQRFGAKGLKQFLRELFHKVRVLFRSVGFQEWRNSLARTWSGTGSTFNSPSSYFLYLSVLEFKQSTAKKSGHILVEELRRIVLNRRKTLLNC